MTLLLFYYFQCYLLILPFCNLSSPVIQWSMISGQYITLATVKGDVIKILKYTTVYFTSTTFFNYTSTGPSHEQGGKGKNSPFSYNIINPFSQPLLSETSDLFLNVLSKQFSNFHLIYDGPLSYLRFKKSYQQVLMQ